MNKLKITSFILCSILILTPVGTTTAYALDNAEDINEKVTSEETVKQEVVKPVEEKNTGEFTSISTKEELNDIRNNLSGKYYLANNIVFTEEDFQPGGAFYNGGSGWNPIGGAYNPFTGILDGKDFTIQGLKINFTKDSNPYSGLFGNSSGTVKNLGIVDGSFIGTAVGSIPGSYGTYDTLVGAIAGYSTGRIENCYNENSYVAIKIPESGFSEYAYAGGIVGNNFGGTVINCSNTGFIEVDAPAYWMHIGGIAGDNRGNISNCYNLGNLKSKLITKASSAHIDIGGVSGGNYTGGNIDKCYNTGNIESEASAYNFMDTSAGGVVGSNIYNVTNTFNAGSINVKGKANMDRNYVGGVAGMNRRKLDSCYSVGDLMANDEPLRALIGKVENYESTYSVTSSYYVNSKLPLEEFLKSQTFEGFDFSNIWTMDGHSEYLFPKLKGLEMFFQKSLIGIEITQKPNKTSYVEGESFDGNGMIVTAKYNNGTKEEVKDFKTTGYDPTVGTKKIQVEYEGKTASFEVVVNPKITEINHVPVITCEDRITLKQNKEFDPKAWATAEDKEDGDLTSSIEIIKNDIDISKIGFYNVTYKVTDSKGAAVTKTILVDVVSNFLPRLGGVEDITVKLGDKFTIYDGLVAWDQEDGDLIEKVKVEGDFDLTKEGIYYITYSVTDSDENTVTIKRTITVRSNEKPVLIGVKNKTVFLGSGFYDPRIGVTATDKEDGDITDKISVVGAVNTDAVGTYHLTYYIQDSDFNEVKQDATVKVVEKEVKIESLIGSTRYDTAAKLSQSQFNSVDTIVIANGNALADGLAVTPLAAHLKAPVLLSTNTTLPEETKAEIKRLKPKNAIIVGGTGVVGVEVQKELNALGISTINRLGGKTRYETSLEIAKYIDKNCYSIEKVVVSNGLGQADALSIASVAGRDKMAIILVEKDSVPQNVFDWLKTQGLKEAYIIGGVGVVSDNVLNKINTITTSDIKNNRLGGLNRYATNAMVIDRFFGDTLDKVYIAKGGQLIDALAAGPVAAINGSPVVLTADTLTYDQQLVLEPKSANTIYRTGGGITDSAVNMLKNWLK